ncbi:hypothetical protein J132_03286 [Termitomyces sp. J132]|nr:hypothetical protein J132_03286 [Termitomyces sp. J132]
MPFDLGGFDFPSIARINTGIAIDRLARDLNHHIPVYCLMANITLADWSCHINSCCYPLDGRGLERTFSRYSGSILAAWIVAHEHLAKLGLSLRQTDASYLLEGRCSISHALTSTMDVLRPNYPVNGHTLRSIRSMGFYQLQDIGKWAVNNSGSSSFVVSEMPAGKWSSAQRRNWELIRCACSRIQIGMLYAGQPELLLPVDQRRLCAETYIEALISNSRLPPTDEAIHTGQWGTDGSMVPSSAGMLDDKSVTAAVTGSKTTVIKLSGRNISILHGELMGLISGVISSRLSNTEGVIYTDHLNSVRLIDDSLTTPNLEHKLRHMNARSYYRWLLDLLKHRTITIHYTKGHASGSTLPSILNNSADRHAVTAQSNPYTPFAPIPTFFMDDFTLYSTRDGWIECNSRNFVDRLYSTRVANDLEYSSGLRLRRLVYDLGSPPEFPYLRATSCYSAVVQLYAHAGQLPTALRLHTRGKLDDGSCRFGCRLVSEDEHHIFVDCPRFADMRRESYLEVVHLTSNKCSELIEKGLITADTTRRLSHAAKSLFRDDSSVWPLHNSAYYLGRVPDVLRLLWSEIDSVHGPSLEHRRQAHYFASAWHLSAIRLAGRIWGQVQRMMARDRGL